MIKQGDPKKRGKASRNKGKSGELELMHILNETWGLNVRRGHVFDHESDLVGLTGVHPEVKRQEHLNVYAAVDQAHTEAKKRQDGVPAVFHRRDRGEWLVTMSLDDWIDFYGAWKDER